MKQQILVALIVILAGPMKAQILKGPNGETFKREVIADSVEDAWQLRLDKKGFLWYTESRGLKVVRMNLQTKEKKTLLDLSKSVNYKRYDTIDDKIDGGKPWPAGGLMGLAFHPGIFDGKPYVFLNYIYAFEGAAATGMGCRDQKGGCMFTAKLVRYRFDEAQEILTDPVVLCDTIPASNDHNGSRLVIAPVNDSAYLFYSIGDMGAGQFDNGGRPNHAQDTTRYEGKVLRFNIEPDADTNTTDKWIPNDNPFNNTQQNAVWSYGHRNPQGLFYAVIDGKGLLYSCEHGPYSDDEINIIERGKNYGHPLVIGFVDGNYDGLAASVSSNKALPGRWHTTYPFIGSETANAKEIGERFRAPLKTFYPNSNAFLKKLFAATIKDDKAKQEWRSEAPSSIAIYTQDAIPGWKNSILMPALKTGRLLRMQLSENGRKITGDTVAYFPGKMRYRDVAISDDGKTIYLSVDKSTVTSGPSEKDQDEASLHGVILAFTYQGKQ